MRHTLLLLSCVIVLAGCGSAAALTTAPATANTAPTTATDPDLAAAVKDALATIGEINRLYLAGASDATFGAIADVATSGRTSLAREPAHITTMLPFHVYDLSLQLFQANAVLKDGAQMIKDHDWLVSDNVRGKLAALVP